MLSEKSPNGMQFARVFAHDDGRALMVNNSKDCERHVKVWNVTKTEKIIPYGVEEAARFLFAK
jgi:hypothetical protein